MRVRVLRVLDRLAEPLRRRGMRRTLIAGRRLVGALGAGTVGLGDMRLGGGVEHRSYLATLRAGANEPGTRARFQDAVLADQREGREAGVRATPTFFINGRKIEGALPIETFRDAVQQALREAR